MHSISLPRGLLRAPWSTEYIFLNTETRDQSPVSPVVCAQEVAKWWTEFLVTLWVYFKIKNSPLRNFSVWFEMV